MENSEPEVFYTNVRLQLVWNPDNVYSGNTVEDFKQRFFNHKKSFNDSINCNDNFQIP